MRDTSIAGIDLAASFSRPTGYCLLRGLKAAPCLLFGDEEILYQIEQAKPDLVAIDAPLTIPPGRQSMEERKGSHFRPCDEQLRQRRIPFFPITLGPMRALTLRGIKLRQELEGRGFRVIEVYPGGAQDLWGIPRAKKNLEELSRGLRRFRIKGLRRACTAHELDAVSAAYVGLLFLGGKAQVLGDFSSGAIIMPFP